MRVYQIIIAILAVLQIAARTPPDLLVEFTSAKPASCAIHLTRGSGEHADYAVTDLDLPLSGRVTLAMRILNVVTGGHSLGQAGQLTAGGVWNTFLREDGVLLRALVNDDAPAGFDFGPAVALARAARSTDDADLARYALDFAEGRATGRGYWVDVTVPMRGFAFTAQTQGLVVLLPDQTYPRGLMISAHVALPTHRYLANLFWPAKPRVGDDARDHAAIVHPVRVRESERNRDPSYRPRPSSPLEREPPEPFEKAVTVE